MAAQPPPAPPAVEARFADLCKVRSLAPLRPPVWFSCVFEVLRFWGVGALVQELGLGEGVAGEAAALLDEVKGVLLAAPSVGGRSVRNTAFCGLNL